MLTSAFILALVGGRVFSVLTAGDADVLNNALNLATLALLFFMNKRGAKEGTVHALHTTVADAAASAASAAKVSAEAARITKELGGAVRSINPEQFRSTDG